MFEIGSSLREARTRQGLAFEEMEQRTKVRAKYLRFLEEERFDQLPGHTYTKGFLRTYADSLGLDGDLYVDEYNSRYVGLEDDSQPRLPSRPSSGRERRQRSRESRTVVVALGAIIVVTALVIAAWRFGGEDAPQVQGINAGGHAAASAATVVITAAKGPTYLDVRVSSAKHASEPCTDTDSSCRPLFTGTLAKGQSQRFTASSPLAISVSKPRNVIVVANGRRVPMSGGGVVVGGGSVVGG